jgi:hypothetical protein
MNRKLASTLSITSTAAAVFAAAAIASGAAYAESPTIDSTPFVSSKSRAEVRAELMGHSGSSEWAMQLNEPVQPNSAYTREAAQAEYIASRNEVNARNAEDSGSSYIATLPGRPSVAMAGAR